MSVVHLGVCDVMLFLHTERAPTRDEWRHVMEVMTDYERKGDLRRLRILAITDGGGPDAEMRGDVQELYRRARCTLPTAVVMSSLLARGLVAAISWFNPHIKGFSPRDLAAALAHLGLPSNALPRLRAEAHALKAQLPPLVCLRLIDGALAEVA